MKLLFLGDSITEGVGASRSENNYVNLVGNTLNCEAINYGVSGTRIGRQTFVHCSAMWNYDFRLRVGAQISEGNFERALIFCGTGMGIHIAASKCPHVHAGVVESVPAALRAITGMANAGINTTELLANKLNHPIREYHYYIAIKLIEKIIGM